VDLSRPYSAVVPSVDGDVLVALAGTTRPLTGRQVADLTRRGSQRAVSTVLDRLVEQGLVLRQKAGSSYLHTLNRDHLAAPAVEALTRLRSELFDRIGRHVAAWAEPALNVTVFGSTARGDGDVRSDVDLFLVRSGGVDERDEGWRQQVVDLAESIRSWTGNHASTIEMSVDELPAFVREAPPVLAPLRDEGVDLAGATLRSLLRDAERPA
jgi:DNA-binding transcriptional ArsR family regulator